MSRDIQDIPIRPRYGLAELEQRTKEKEHTATTAASSRQRKLNATPNSEGQQPMSVGGAASVAAAAAKNNLNDVASSYTEIPFLARSPMPIGDSDSGANVKAKKAKEINEAAAVGDDNGEGDYNVADEDVDDDDDDDSEGKLTTTDSSQGQKGKDKGAKPKQRPKSLQYDSSFPYELDSSTSAEGQIRHFVAENVEDKIRNAALKCGASSHNSTPSNSTAGSLLTRHYLQTQVPQIDANALSDIEIEAQYLASSVNNLLENLCNLLHSISSITADNVEVHRSAVNKLTDSMDANIKCMYTIMAKTEEITKAMKPTEQLAQRIREIKRLVDMLDATM